MTSHHIIDRRKNQKDKSINNRSRFIRRVKSQVKEAAKRAIREGDVQSITSSKGRKVTVPVKDLSEPVIRHGEGGNRDLIHPGNKEFVQGDRISRPPTGSGKGQGKAGDSGDGEDSFTFELTKDEFLNLFFEDLELPDMIKKNIAVTETFTYNRAGFTNEGTPAKMNITRSMRQAKGRRAALRGPKRKKIRELEAQLESIVTELDKGPAESVRKRLESRRMEIESEIEILKRKIRAIPYVDDIDLRYNFWKKTPQPVTQCVMFCIMDVSGSMTASRKELAKRFFMLLYLFLHKSYEKVDIVFVRHHTEAKEVDEEEFFYSRETGGTMVSPALDLVNEIIEQRYPTQTWNIYACQASDGDNFPTDTAATIDTLATKILPKVQYFAYIELETGKRPTQSDLWGEYNSLSETHANFNIKHVDEPADIYPVFRRLFEKKITG